MRDMLSVPTAPPAPPGPPDSASAPPGRETEGPPFKEVLKDHQARTATAEGRSGGDDTPKGPKTDDPTTTGQDAKPHDPCADTVPAGAVQALALAITPPANVAAAAPATTATPAAAATTAAPAVATAQPAATTAATSDAPAASATVQGTPANPAATPPAVQAHRAAPAHAPAPPAPLNTAHAVERIQAMVHVAHVRGAAHARLQLHPAELGGVTIQLHVTHSGLRAHIAADNAEALPLLQKAAADLQRSLEDRGIDLRGLDFELAPDAEADASRDDGRAQQRAGAFTFAGGRGEHDGDGDDDPLTTAMTATRTVGLPAGALVDVRA